MIRAKASRDILHYIPEEDDSLIDNPYLDEVLNIVQGLPGKDVEKRRIALSALRYELISKYSFSIPGARALKLVSGCSPLVEIGGGNGYWARCLSAMGADIICFDTRPPSEAQAWEIERQNQWFDEDWHEVCEGDEYAAGHFPKRTLLLCWPPPENPMALRALNEHRRCGGRTLIYIGDPFSSGDADFHRELAGLECLAEEPLPSWPDISDRVFLYRYQRGT